MKPERDAEVLAYMRSESARLYATDITVRLGLRYGQIYPILARLEHAGSVASDWDGGMDGSKASFPRRRIYWAQAGS